MIRALAIAVLCALAILAGDLVFRTSLLHRVRPLILSPLDDAVVAPPVQLHWEGQPRMRVRLAVAGAGPRDLGVQQSPFEIAGAEFPRDGGYEVEIRAEHLGAWINASRRFQVHVASPPPPPVPTPGRDGDGVDVLHVLDAARRARDRAQSRTKFLRAENAALRDETQRLAAEIESLSQTQEEDAAHAAELETRLGQLGDELRALGNENAALRVRLSNVIPCSVWGYYSYPRPQTIPVTRKYLLVSDSNGRIFRALVDCEGVRHTDSTAASVCFCVGNSWGG